MPAFTVEELMKRSFSGITYKLPESIKRALKQLESCLEITDAPESAASSHSHHHHNPRKGEHESSGGFRSQNHNRYDMSKGTTESDKSRMSRKDGKHLGNGSKSKKEDWSKRSASQSNLSESSSSAAIEDEWALMRSFKATKIETKTGIEKTVNDIRVTMNKMSTANYEKQKDIVLGYVSAYFDSGEVTPADTRRISKAIFDIASTNKFYSEIYARLYKELVTSNSVFRDLLDEFIVGFTNTESLPVYIDPDVDYDGFCAYSKACDIRKSTSTFLVNCLLLELLPAEKLANILCEILDSIQSQILEEGKAKIVEESVENVFILATLCKKELADGTKSWHEIIIPSIKKLVAERGAGHPSLSNRAAFKCMDLLDNL